ncbi:Peptidyl-prolyl cis-trans isomerase-like 2 [Myotis davidii]|uniref:Peptidyl-prolyl cis-trans isomerase n=1 Tax=Myotis davidii TaxID=225400 RepID=L5M158_MYODS|nr:Peptidyl-prolyl cis-trans isomerase-like 2 [Myotis davidii]
MDRGILSMANSGPYTNKSQFFTTFRSCAYLDKKHTIFRRVVGGFDTLTAVENVESDPKTDRPKDEILKRAADEEPFTSAAVPVARKQPRGGFKDLSAW